MNNSLIILLFIVYVWTSCYGAEDFSYKDIQMWRAHSPLCNNGRKQSPISIDDKISRQAVANASTFKFVDYPSATLLVSTLITKKFEKVPYVTGTLINNQQYFFVRTHAHVNTAEDNGSEHSINGKRYAIESHLFHVNRKYGTAAEARKHPDGILVVAAIFKLDDSKINSTGPCNFDVHSIKSFYTYAGSLTTPPCSENVLWIISDRIFSVRPYCARWIRRMLPKGELFNVRPIQLRNGRTIVHYRSKSISSETVTHTLRQHMLRHAGKQYKCGLPGCPTILRTETELNNHRRLVHEPTSEDRRFQCHNCSYAAKTKIQLVRHQSRHERPDAEDSTQQYSCDYGNCTFKTKISAHLKRHMRLHTGKKPYKCRHCSYASNNLENLRKHVLGTNIHPGKTIYQCGSCPDDGTAFQTNFSKELRAHLLDGHPNEYPGAREVNEYIAGIFEERAEEA